MKADATIILCATDAGGVRNIAPLLEASRGHRLAPVLVTAPARLPLFGALIQRAERVVLADDLDAPELASLVDEVRPLACISGTTRYLSPDRQLVSIANAKGIRTVVVLDEWFNYRYRFEDLQTSELLYLPRAIAVQDRQAREEAIAEGVPGELCQITGSPALAELTRMAYDLAASPPEVPEILNGAQGRAVVTFLSETHAVDYGTEPGAAGLMGPFIGYTEITVRQAILEVLGRLGRPVVLVEKLHPAGEQQQVREPIPGNVDYRATRETSLWPLLWHSQLVLGMRSMGLLEAQILGCEVASFQPGLLGLERCTAVRLGLVPKLKQGEELQAWLDARLSRKLNEPRSINRHPFARPDAASQVVALALSKEGIT